MYKSILAVFVFIGLTYQSFAYLAADFDSLSYSNVPVGESSIKKSNVYEIVQVSSGSSGSYSISSSQSWLTFDRTSGTLSSQGANHDIDVYINTTGMSYSQTYSATVTMNLEGTRYYRTVSVTTESEPEPEPAIGMSALNQSFTLEIGGSETKNDVWEVINQGDIGSTLTYSLSKTHVSPAGGNSNWLTLSRTSGSLTRSGVSVPDHDIDMTANATGLTANTIYECQITITCNDPDDSGPWYRTITLNASPPPGPDWDITGVDFDGLPPYEPGEDANFNVTVSNIGNQDAPASKMLVESWDRDTNGDYFSEEIDVPAIVTGGSTVVPVGVRVGHKTEILIPKFTANSGGLPEQDDSNNESGTILATVKGIPSRLFANSSKKTGFSGDPVNTATGNFVTSSTDLSINSRIAGFEFKRFYNSVSTEVSSMGLGWRHSFMWSMDLENADAPGVVFPDGHSEYWRESNGSYVPAFKQIFNKLEKDNSDWLLTLKNLDVLRFNSSGVCQSLTDKNGNSLSFTYSGSNLITVTDPANRSLTLSYSGGKLSRVSDVGSRSVAFGYSGDNLTTITDVNGKNVSYGYDTNDLLNRITDQRGTQVLSLVYDVEGRAISQTDGNNNVTQFSYNDPQDFSTTITDPLSNETIHVHNRSYQLMQVIDEYGRSVSYTYDSQTGLRNSITDKAGNDPTTFTYDTSGNLLETEYPDTSTVSHTYDSKDLLLTTTDQAGEVTTWTYDSRGNATSEEDPLGNSRSWIYNSWGQPTTETDKNGSTRSYTYDASGKLTRVEDADGVGSNYGYDALWRRTTVEDDRGNTVTTVYNADDSIAEVRKPIGTVGFSYDEVGNLLKETDAKGKETTYTYDGNGNRKTVTLPDSLGSTSYAYDGVNRLISTTDGRSNVWQKVYYNDGRLHKEIDPELNETVSTYDANGNLLTKTDGSGRSVAYTYNDLNQKISLKDALNHTTIWTYDVRGNQSSITDPKGNRVEYVYDKVGRLSTVTEKGNNSADDQVTSYTYDAEGNMRFVEDAEGSISENRYSLAGRRTHRIDALGRITQFSYDAAGNLSTVQYANGDDEEYVYDQNNRRTRVTYNGSKTAIYTLDLNGNTTSVADWNGTTSYTYDAVNRLTSVTDIYGKTVQYGYDLAGNRTSILYPSAGTVTYSYDDRNGLARVTDWNSSEFNYTLDGAARILSRSLPNGITGTYGYDAAGRMTSLSYAKGGVETVSYIMTLDGLGNPTQVSTSGLPSIDTLSSSSLSYQHDAAHQMLSDSKNTYQYDQRGSIDVTNYNGGGQTDFSFGSDGLLSSYTLSGGYTVTNTYDSNQHRIAATRNGVESRYVLDRQRGMVNVLAEADDHDSINRYFLHGDVTLAMYDSSGNATHYYLNDPFGNVIALTDSSGLPTDKYLYDPFGNIIGQSGNTDNPFKYVGSLGVMSEPGGYYFMRARYYDPVQGRFLSVDPIEGDVMVPGTLHRYMYGLNNTLVYTDPEGEIPVPLITGAIGAGVGFLWGGGSSIFMDLASGEEVNWNRAIGSSVTGAINGAYHGSGASLAGGVLGAIGVGAGASLVGNSVEQGLDYITKGESYEISEAVIETVIGGATSGVSHITSNLHLSKSMRVVKNNKAWFQPKSSLNFKSSINRNKLYRWGIDEGFEKSLDIARSGSAVEKELSVSNLNFSENSPTTPSLYVSEYESSAKR